MAVTSQIVMVDEQEKMNPKVAACYKKAKSGQTTEILDSIAKESLPRAVKILDTLVKTAIPLGIEIDDKLRFSIGKDSVSLRFSESTKEVLHQLTIEEKRHCWNMKMRKNRSDGPENRRSGSMTMFTQER